MGRPSVTFQKRQREYAKRLKRKEKIERREARKRDSHRSRSAGPPVETVNPADLGLPQLDFIRSKEHRLPEELQQRYSPEPT